MTFSWTGFLPARDNVQGARVSHKKGMDGSMPGKMKVALSGYWRRVKHRQLIMQAPLIGEGFLAAARHIQNEVKQLPAYLFNGLFTGSDGARIDVH